MAFVDFGELRTHYELTGSDGPVLVFSNSLGTDCSMWDPQIPELAKRFRILRYDTRGHGQSSVTPGDYTIAQLGRDVLSLLDSLSIDRVDFCGLSMGGMIGIWLAANAPNRLNQLVVCNTAARIGTQDTWNTRIAAVRTNGMKQVASAVIERWFTPEFRSSSPEKTAHARQMLEKSPPDGYASCCAAIRDMDLRESVDKISISTMVVYGAKDPVTPRADAMFLKENIRGAIAVELSAAHLSNVEQAEAFTEAVRDFLCESGDRSWMTQSGTPRG